MSRSISGGGGALPNLVVIGAAKCGTSALHYYLDLHPDVRMSSPKELFFFVDEEDFVPEPFLSEPRERRLFGTTWNWSRGRAWYEGHFDPAAAVRGESTPAYASLWYPGVAARMGEVVPDARLIFMVRDPFERIVSHYMHFRADGREWRSLPDAVRHPANVYLARSRYASLLRPFLERFDRSRILILRQEDLLHRRRETMREAFRFVGVEEGFWSPRMERERQPSGKKGWRYRGMTRLQSSRLAAPLHRLPQEVKWVLERAAYSRSGADRPAIDAELRAGLLERLEGEVRSLEELTGWDLARWRAPAPAPAHGA